jgi:two-component system, OmpR family, sensor kinase
MDAEAVERQVLLRRATRTVAVRMAVAVAVVVAVAGTFALVAVSARERTDARTLVHDAAISADDVGDPPSGVTLLEDRGGTVTVTRGATRAVARLDPANMPTGASLVTVGGITYDAYVADADGGVRFAALTSMDQRADTGKLMVPMLIAGLVAVAGSALAGGLIGRQAARPLADALTMQRRFVADASHELRTPLTILHIRTQLLQRRLKPLNDPETNAEVDELLEDTRAMSDVVHDLLLSAELLHKPDRTEIVDLTALAAETARRFAPVAEQRQIDVRADADPAKPMLTMGVPSALTRAVSALVDNAIAHGHPGGHVVISVLRRGAQVVVSVIDDGEGIDPEHLPELLHRFARGPSAGGQGRRFGLGLSLVEEVVRAHGGLLEFDGKPGEGSRFALVLPATDAEPADAEPADAEPADAEPTDAEPTDDSSEAAPERRPESGATAR